MALDLVSPVVPDANSSKGPELFLQGLQGGLAAFARFADIRRQNESAMAELALRERMSQEAHDIELKKIEAELPMYQAHAKYFDALTALSVSKAKAYADGTATGSQRLIQRQQAEQALANEVNDHATELKLDDPNFATKEPVRFAANVMQFADAWGRSPLPWVQQAIRKYQTQADQQKISIRPLDGNGLLTGDGKPTAIWKVVRDLQDPNTKQQTIDLMKANGYMNETTKNVPGTPTKSWSRPFDTAWDFLLGPTDKKETVDTPSPALQNILDKSKGVQFEHIPSRLPPASPKSSAVETLPPPDLPPDTSGNDEMPQASTQPADTPSDLFDPTQTDLYIQHAKNAIARGAPIAAVAQRLQGDFGIDPAALWAA